jgi:hypothetical protein
MLPAVHIDRISIGVEIPNENFAISLLKSVPKARFAIEPTASYQQPPAGI